MRMRIGPTRRRTFLLVVGTVIGGALLCSFLLSQWATSKSGSYEVSGRGDRLYVKDGHVVESAVPRKAAGRSPPVPGGPPAGLADHLAKAGEEVAGGATACTASFDSSCKNPRIHVRIGVETEQRPPFACLNDIDVFPSSDVARGVLAALLDSETQEIKEVSTFDVATTDAKLIHWLRGLASGALVIVASFGDVAERISPDARRALESVGAGKISAWRGGTAYALLGQRGLEKGAAAEVISALGHGTATAARIEDCFEFPMGKLNSTLEDGGSVNRVDEAKLAELLHDGNGGTGGAVALGEEWARCGLTAACGEDSVSMHFYSGANKDDHPKMCVGGRMIFGPSLNGAGRGLNVAVIDAKTKRVLKTDHFDTYEKESTSLELFLDGLTTGDIVAVVSFDEASTMLSDMAKQIFDELGSSMVHRLKFRASWYFVGQKGIRSFTPFEDLNFASGNSWAAPINTGICVPSSLSGASLESRESEGKERRKYNAAKRHFCAKYDRLDAFCEEAHLDDPIEAAPLVDKSRADDAIFNAPILVVAGMNLARLRRTLDGLIRQEGINTQLVIVAHYKEYKMAGDLAALFHFKPLPMNTTSSYNDLLLSSLSAAFSVFPKASSIIVLEEEVTPSPDLLFFFSQLLPVLEKSPEIDLIHSFNYNGFNRTSSNASVVYTTEGQPPSHAYLMKRSFYEANIAKNASTCCTRLHWWKFPRPPIGLVPDVSRHVKVWVPRPDDLTLADEVDKRIHAETRIFNRVPTTRLSTGSLSPKEYGILLSRLQRDSKEVSGASIAACKGGKEEEWKRLEGLREKKPLVILYAGRPEMESIASCLGLFREDSFVAGSFKGTVRFHLHGVPVMLVPK